MIKLQENMRTSNGTVSDQNVPAMKSSSDVHNITYLNGDQLRYIYSNYGWNLTSICYLGYGRVITDWH